MILPSELRHAIDQFVYDVPPPELQSASQDLTKLYREELGRGRRLLVTSQHRAAYLAVRMPATFAAISAALEAVEVQRPDFAPRTMLDLGAGPGTGMWAAAEVFTSLESAINIEQDRGLVTIGKKLAAAAMLPSVQDAQWREEDLLGLRTLAPQDLVVLSYVLRELTPESRERVLDRARAATADTLLIVEPGTPAGFETMLKCRDEFLQRGWSIIAPCSHHETCPLLGRTWCHFSQRLARSARHRQAKGADLGYEDEKYTCLAVTPHSFVQTGQRIISTPEVSKPHVRLTLCASGEPEIADISRQNKNEYKTARKKNWGDIW